MKEEYKVKFEMTTKKYEHDKTDRPTLIVHSYHNYEDDPELPNWSKDADAEFSLTDERDKMYMMGTRDFYDCSTIILSKSEVKNLLRRLRKLERMMK